ncbi:MAG: ABC transporter substrate-binding protein [Hyphomicrobiales bacterium]|nr:ABC transporter substrate-binding protein [Hyphomicrobiales bacterium]
MKLKMLFIAIVLICSGSFARAEKVVFPADIGVEQGSGVVVYSSLDTSAARPLIKAFQNINPDISIFYHELQTLEIHERVVRETDEGKLTADLIISSAMDLQMKLANDGYARKVNFAGIAGWPNWAKWRNTAFALTFEPAVMIYHKPSFSGVEIPKTRAALSEFLASNNNAFYGRIATYDIERAGLGFLFLARDEEHYRDIWQLVQMMGSSGVKLYSKSSAILQRVSDGRSAIGYNILGSYAKSWAEHNPDLGIILPTDHTVVMSRIALIPEAARSHELGRKFLSFLMSMPGQEVMAKKTGIRALHPQLSDENTASALRQQAGNKLRPIPVSPGLLVYLDQVKRARLIERWNKALRNR